jgi:O-antigen/teichoic acid export membrane protein
MLKKIGLITITNIIIAAVGYLLLPVYLRLMTQEEFGEFSFIISVMSSFSLILSLSLYIPFIRNYCADETDDLMRSELVSTVFNSLFIWLIIIDLFFLLAKPLIIDIYIGFFNISNFANEKYYLVLLSLNTGGILLYCYSLLMAKKNTRAIITFTLSRFIFVSASSLIFIYFNFFGQESVLNRLIGVFIAQLLVALVSLFIYVRPIISLRINLLLLKDQFKIALPLIPSGLIGLITVAFDRGLITEHHGLKELANYNLAMMALVPMHMVMTATQVAWAPHLFSLKDPKSAMRQTIKIMKIAFLLMIISAPLLSFAIYLALIYNFIGAEYSVVPKIIIYASIGVIALVLLQLNNNMFVYLKKTKYQFGIGLIILIINLSVNILLIPNYSFYGATVAAGLANLTGLGVGLFLLIRMTKNNKGGHA